MKTWTLLVSLSALPLTGCHREERVQTPLIGASQTIAVTVLPLQSVTLQGEVLATGLLSTRNEARYAFKIGGVIDRIWVQEGQAFQRGQRLAALKGGEINDQLRQAELAQEKAQRDYGRTMNLYRDSVATLEQLQNAQTTLELARKTTSLVAFNRQYAYIYATTDGFVTRKLANEGEVVSPGSPVLATNETAGPRAWTLKLGLNDRDWAKTAIGNRALVTVDAFPDRTFSGTLFRKSTAADPGSGTFGVEVNVDMAGVTPSMGMFGKARLYTGPPSRRTVIPYEALVEADGHNAFVYVPKGRNKVQRVPIVIDQFDEGHIVVKQGLERVRAIVVSNSAFLNESSTIQIVRQP